MLQFFCKLIIENNYTKKKSELARIRTWNLLIRSQTRYPLRHWTGMTSEVGPVALGLVRPTLCSGGRKNKDNSTIRVSVV